MQAKLNIPDEMADKVSSWEDGQTYQVSITQTAPGQFDLAGVEDEDADETKAEGGKEEDMGGGSDMGKMHDNPAIAIVMMKKKKA